MSQNTEILKYLEKNGSISPAEAYENPEIRSMRLSERIRELQRQGVPIHKKMEHKNNKKYMRYFLLRPEQTRLNL